MVRERVPSTTCLWSLRRRPNGQGLALCLGRLLADILELDLGADLVEASASEQLRMHARVRLLADALDVAPGADVVAAAANELLLHHNLLVLRVVVADRPAQGLQVPRGVQARAAPAIALLASSPQTLMAMVAHLLTLKA